MIVRHGLELVLRRWRSILALAILISIGCVVFSLALADVFTQTTVLRGGRALRAQHAVAFSAFYKEGAVSAPNTAALEIISKEISAGRAYSAVINNADLSESASNTEARIVLLLGDAITDLYPDLRLCAPAPCAMRGAQAGGQAETELVFAGQHIPIAGALPRHATWFDPNSTGIPLTQDIVVRWPPTEINRLDDYAKEELLTRSVMLGSPRSVVDQFVSTVRTEDVYLVPSDLAVDQPRGFRQVVSRSALYLAGFASYLALMFAVLSASLNNLLKREASRFQIQRMAGATRSQINGSVTVFLGVSTILLPVLTCLPLLAIGGSFAGAFQVVLVGCAVIWIVETLRFRRRVAGQQEVGRS